MQAVPRPRGDRGRVLVQPPDDEIALLDERQDGGELVGGYAWSCEPGVRAGELRLTVEDGRTKRLVVSFD